MIKALRNVCITGIFSDKSVKEQKEQKSILITLASYHKTTIQPCGRALLELFLMYQVT